MKPEKLRSQPEWVYSPRDQSHYLIADAPTDPYGHTSLGRVIENMGSFIVVGALFPYSNLEDAKRWAERILIPKWDQK